MKRITLIEDDQDLAHILSRHLEKAGYATSIYHRGDTGLQSLMDDPPDLAIVDIMLPGIDGLQVVQELRKKSNLLVLLVSAKRSEIDRVLGLEMGGDDYLTKPLSAREMLARVKALFRRYEWENEAFSASLQTEVVKAGRLALDMDRRILSAGTRRTEVTNSEYAILCRMMQHPGKVFTREDLSHCLDGEGNHRSRALDVHIGNLRKKVAELGIASTPFQSVHGVGYRLDE